MLLALASIVLADQPIPIQEAQERLREKQVARDAQATTRAAQAATDELSQLKSSVQTLQAQVAALKDENEKLKTSLQSANTNLAKLSRLKSATAPGQQVGVISIDDAKSLADDVKKQMAEALLVSIGSDNQGNTFFHDTALLALGLSILLGSLSIYGEVWFAKQTVISTRAAAKKYISSRDTDDLLPENIKRLPYIKTSERLCCAFLLIALISLVTLDWQSPRHSKPPNSSATQQTVRQPLLQ
jgi:ABC-type transporter Mla subunit MlaD